jgi:hypothetical protein
MATYNSIGLHHSSRQIETFQDYSDGNMFTVTWVAKVAGHLKTFIDYNLTGADATLYPKDI